MSRALLTACLVLAGCLFHANQALAQQPYQFGLRFRPITFQPPRFAGIPFRQPAFTFRNQPPIQFRAITFPSINAPYGPRNDNSDYDNPEEDRPQITVDWRQRRTLQRIAEARRITATQIAGNADPRAERVATEVASSSSGYDRREYRTTEFENEAVIGDIDPVRAAVRTRESGRRAFLADSGGQRRGRERAGPSVPVGDVRTAYRALPTDNSARYVARSRAGDGRGTTLR